MKKKGLDVKIYNNSSSVEVLALEKSKHLFMYAPTEKIKIIEAPNFPSLGKLVSFRFLEWLQLNPEGVISLPTGKTPEYFIKWTKFFLDRWYEKDVQKELGEWGLNIDRRPDMSTFRFVQIDEFYPMNSAQENSFASYISRFYFENFGLDSKKALLMDTWKIGAPKGKSLGHIFSGDIPDLTLRFKEPETELEKKQYHAIVAADQYAMEYENRIKEIGGIGFFLGGIGPDGHIGFNIKGSDHLSTTRLLRINYETVASAASDLGGIEVARQKAVLTIGLNTIVQNCSSTAIIIAAGESKSNIVKDAVEQKPSVLYPATVLHKLSGARFYLTKGAARRLVERQLQVLSNLPKIPTATCEQILIDIAVQNKTRLVDLTQEKVSQDSFGRFVSNKKHDLETFAISATDVVSGLKEKINTGQDSFAGKKILHTAPHHDDIMLGYLPFVVDLTRQSENMHYFATMTSGFTSVTNNYTLSQIQNLEDFINKECFSNADSFFKTSDSDNDIYRYLDAVAEKNKDKCRFIEACRMLRNFVELFNLDINFDVNFDTKETIDFKQFLNEIKELKKYFKKSYPGKRDSELVQKLKGMIREWEEELLWGNLGFNRDHIFHLRLGFYTGDIFTQQPEFERDVKPILNLIEKLDPDIITVALDPEASGPDTHYKVLQATSLALMEYLKDKPNKKISVWGYRNVWYRFMPTEANIFVPVSMNSLALLTGAFNTCFGSQREASFPSCEYDGPFCDLAQKIMVEQYQELKTCLGEDYFYKNQSSRLRATRGFCFLKAMDPEEFFGETDLLKKHME